MFEKGIICQGKFISSSSWCVVLCCILSYNWVFLNPSKRYWNSPFLWIVSFLSCYFECHWHPHLTPISLFLSLSFFSHSLSHSLSLSLSISLHMLPLRLAFNDQFNFWRTIEVRSDERKITLSRIFNSFVSSSSLVHLLQAVGVIQLNSQL